MQDDLNQCSFWSLSYNTWKQLIVQLKQIRHLSIRFVIRDSIDVGRWYFWLIHVFEKDFLAFWCLPGYSCFYVTVWLQQCLCFKDIFLRCLVFFSELSRIDIGYLAIYKKSLLCRVWLELCNSKELVRIWVNDFFLRCMTQ